MIFFVIANSVDPDEMPNNVALHQDLHYLLKYKLKSSQGKSVMGYFVLFVLYYKCHTLNTHAQLFSRAVKF